MVETTLAKIALIIRGAPAEATLTVRAIKAITANLAYSIYLVVDDAEPAEAWNRAAAMRSEPWLLFLEAGSTPLAPHWLDALLQRCPNPGAACGQILGSESSWLPMLTPRSTFDLLGGFDAERFAQREFQSDYLNRLAGMGYASENVPESEFLAGSTQLRQNVAG